MDNIKYAYQTNMWGLMVQYPRRNHWDEWYRKDMDNSVYYLDWENILKYHVAMGFTGLEFMFHMEPYIREFFGHPRNFVDFIKSIGLEEVAAVFTVGIGAENKNMHENAFKSVTSVIDFANELGAEKLTIMPASGYYGNGPLSDEQLDNCVEFMDKIGEYGASKGVLPCIHSEFWCAINKYDLEKYIEKVNHDNVAFCLDTAQVGIMGFEQGAFYEKYHDIIKYIHLKDTPYLDVADELRFKAGAEFPDEGDRWFYEPGAGKVDFESLYRGMKKHNYKGWVTIETDGTPDPLATMALSKYYIEHVLSPIYK